MRRQEQRSGDISSAHSKRRGLGAAAFPTPSVTLSTVLRLGDSRMWSQCLTVIHRH